MTAPRDAIEAFNLARSGGSFGDPNQYPPGMRELLKARDPANQAREMEIFLRLQQAQRDQMMKMLADMQGPTPGTVSVGPMSYAPGQFAGQTGPVPIMAQQMGQSLQQQQTRPEAYQDLAGMSNGELISRAQVLGVDNAQDIPADALRHIIAERRQDIRPHEGDAGVFGMPDDAIMKTVAMAGIGAGQGLAQIATNMLNVMDMGNEYILPEQYQFRKANQHKIQNWLAGLDEGVRANMTPSEQKYGSLFQGLGSMLPYANIGASAFRGMSAVVDNGAQLFPAIGRMLESPLARGGVKALATALALDAGSDVPWVPSGDEMGKVMDGSAPLEGRVVAGMDVLFGNRLMHAALGATLGAYGEHLYQQQVDKYKSGAELNSKLAMDAEEWARQTQTEDAQWHFVDENGNHAVETQRIGTGQRLLGGGQPSAAPPSPADGALRDLTPTEQATATTLVNGQPVAPAPTVSVDNYIGPDRQLPGVPTEYARNLMAAYGSARNLGQLDPTTANNLIDTIRRDPAHWITKTPEEVTPDIFALRNQYGDLYARRQVTEDLNERAAIDDQMLDIDARVISLLHEADLNLKSPQARPKLWETIQQGRNSPATPARDLIEQIGTAFRTPDGNKPLLMFHGTGVAFQDIDPNQISGTQNLVGPALYATSDPTVAGGDPLNPSATSYADSKTIEAKMRRDSAQQAVTEMQGAITAFEAQGPASGITPEVYASAKAQLPAAQQWLASLPIPAANVRPFFIAGTNYWNVDNPLPMEVGLQMLQSIAETPAVHTSAEWDTEPIARAWMQLFDVSQQNELANVPRIAGSGIEAQLKAPTGKNFYDLVSQMRGTISQPYGIDKVEKIPDTFGRARLNTALDELGFDGIEYDGGTRAGGAPTATHRAVAVFKIKNVVPAFISGNTLAEHAAQLGINLQKVHEVMDSPIIDQLSAKPVITDSDVAAATASNNPGGLHIVRGVEDMEGFFNGMLAHVFNGSFEGLMKSFRPAIHPSGRVDVIVSSLGEITDDLLAQYKKYGVFKGMDVVMKKSGKLGVVTAVNDEGISWRSESQIAAKMGRASRTKHGNYDVMQNARQVLVAPDLYAQFKDQVIRNVSLLKQAAGQDPATDWIEPLVYQNMPEEFNKFVATIGMTDPGVKAALFRYFDNAYINDVKALDPELSAQADAVSEMNEEIDNASTDGPDLHLMASMKGFDLTTNNDGGFVLHDQQSTQKYPMDNEAAVATFLANAPADRVPNGSPSSEVPAEVAPHFTHTQHATPREDELSEQAVADLLSGEADAEEEPTSPPSGTGNTSASQGPPAAGGGGGGRQPPRTPPTGNAGQGGAPYGGQGGGGNARPTQYATPGLPSTAKIRAAQRAAVMRELNRTPVYELMHRLQRQTAANWISPMRVYMANFEEQLRQAGATSLRPSMQFDKIISGMDIAHNETFHVHEDASNQMQRVDRKDLRDGSWARMWLMENNVHRALYAKANGFSNGAIDAMSKLDKVIVKMHDDAGENGVYKLAQFKAFVRDARAQHEAKKFGPTSYPVSSYPTVGYFGQQAQNLNMRFESIDPRSLVRQYIKAWGFEKYVANDWNQMRSQWTMVKNLEVEGNRPFGGLADRALDWMDYVQRGPEPGKELSVKIVNKVLRMFVPMTFGETRKMMQGMQNMMYQALQGWRVHVIVRDSIQPLLASPTVGFEHLGGAYKTAAMIGSQAREDMKARAYEYGVTQMRMPRVEGTGLFEAEGPTVDTQFNAWQRGVRAVGQTAGDIIRDMTPRGLRNLDLSVFGPLGLYTREGEWNRIIVGQAAFTKFGAEFQKFQMQKQIAAAVGDMTLMPSVDGFMRNLNADSLRPAIARRIQEQIVAGNIDGPQGAMGIYMRAIADRTQFTYGARHSAPAIRTTGLRIGSALTSFGTQTIALIKEFSSYGSAKHIARALLTLGITDGLLRYFDKESGYNFGSWEWLKSVMISGSPVLQQALGTYQTATDVINVASQDHPSSQSVDRLTRMNPAAIAANALRMYNPLQGAIYTFNGLDAAAQSPNPVRSTLGFLATGGTRGAAPEYNRIFSHPTSQDAPVPVQSDRTQYPEQRLPGANQYKNTDSIYGSMMRDMINIQRSYQPGYQPPAPAPVPTDPNSLGKGKGAF